jgi:hypothetical protein
MSEGKSIAPMISIVGRDRKPERVRADARLWWEEDEQMARDVGKAFDAGFAKRNGKTPRIRIKSFPV